MSVEGKREGEILICGWVDKGDRHTADVTLGFGVSPLGPTNRYADKPRPKYPEKC